MSLEKRRFADLTLQPLPIGDKVLGLVYRPLLAFREFWPFLIQLRQFYVAAAKLMAADHWEVVYPGINSQEIAGDMIGRAGLCRVEWAQTRDDSAVLPGTVYAIAKVWDVAEFVALLPKLW
jgi:hypothetical protein